MANFIKLELKNLIKVLDQVRSIHETMAGITKRTVSDMKNRVPSWVAASVSQVYAINKKEIIPGSIKKGGELVEQIGTVGIRGKTIDNLQFVYTGRLLTLTHFHMKPSSQPIGKNGKRPLPYELTAEIYKSKRKKIRGNYGTTPFVARYRGVDLPFQRHSSDRLPLDVLKSTSVPQMIDNETVKKDIVAKLNKGLKERLEHNVEYAKNKLGMSGE